ncbi:hypothetical protein RR48_10408 [Papilio machaon]|uniref:Uncharacterized protein n=1 Tax=Papilio machaon TaxID=76193 RepID=A0A194R4N7_PAPMA|nr:hypothetical protein RR48_10408 [Papilio machaon]
MADTAVASETPAPATPAKKPKATAASAGGVKKPKAKPTHPKTSEMVTSAIKELKERIVIVIELSIYILCILQQHIAVVRYLINLLIN